MRRAALVVPLAVVGLALSAVAVAADDPHAEAKRLTKADMALARRLVATRAELGAGWVATRPSPFDRSEEDCPEFDPDLSAFTITGRAKSAFKGLAGAAVESEVEVFATEDDARGDFRTGAAAMPALVRCLKATVQEAVQGSGAQAPRVSGRIVQPTRIGERRILLRIGVTAVAEGRRTSFFVDLLAFQRGRTIVSLMAFNLFRPLPGLLELARTLDARAAG